MARKRSGQFDVKFEPRLKVSMLSATAVLAALFLGATPAASAQSSTPIYTTAEDYAERGDAKSMEAAYTEILSRWPDDIRALQGRGTARSWQGNRAGAREDFHRILSQDPNNVGALIGIGYDFAWAGEYASAENKFQSAIKLDPANLAASKGLAFTYLWSDQPKKAAQTFAPLARVNPNDAEVQAGLGQAHLKQGHIQRAERAFSVALRNDPRREDAQAGQEKARSMPAAFEVIAFAGNSVAKDAVALRTLEFGSWIDPSTRLWARYDNSLSLDNLALSRSGQEAKAYFIGARTELTSQWIGLAEIGTRDLPAGQHQEIYRVEATRLIKGGQRAFGALQISPHSSGYEDKLAYLGYGGSPARDWRLEGTLYLAQSGAARDDEYRLVGYAERAFPRRWTLGLGAGFGEVSSNVATADGTITSAWALASKSIGRNTFFLQAQTEDTPSSSYTLGSVGLALRFARP